MTAKILGIGKARLLDDNFLNLISNSPEVKERGKQPLPSVLSLLVSESETGYKTFQKLSHWSKNDAREMILAETLGTMLRLSARDDSLVVKLLKLVSVSSRG